MGGWHQELVGGGGGGGGGGKRREGRKEEKKRVQEEGGVEGARGMEWRGGKEHIRDGLVDIHVHGINLRCALP